VRMAAAHLRAAGLVVLLAALACSASEVEQLDMTPNTLETYLRLHPADLDDDDMVHHLGDGFHMRESHLDSLANEIGDHLKFAAKRLSTVADTVGKEGTFSKRWMEDEVQRFHREEGSPQQMKARARNYLRGFVRNAAEEEMMWKNARSEEFYDSLGTHRPEVFDSENLRYDGDKDPEYHDALKSWNSWMAENHVTMEDPDSAEQPDLGEGAEVEDSSWKAAQHPVAKQSLVTVYQPPAAQIPDQQAAMVEDLRKAGYNHEDLKRILDVVVKHTDRRTLGESQAEGKCTPGQCAGVLRDHIVETTADIERLTGKKVMFGDKEGKETPVEAVEALESTGGVQQAAPLPEKGGLPFKAHESKDVVEDKAEDDSSSASLDSEENLSKAAGTDSPPSFGSTREDAKNPEENQAEDITEDDVVGAMENGEDAVVQPIDMEKPANTQQNAPAPPSSAVGDSDEVHNPTGCKANQDREGCKKFKFMGPFACWSMGQKEQPSGKTVAKDLRHLMRTDLYPSSRDKGYVDLSDYRWRAGPTGSGKCIWWNQMFRSMNEPLWMEDNSPVNPMAIGQYKVLRMCMIYSFMESRHWTAQNVGNDYQMALTRGFISEFGSAGKKDMMLPESRKLIANLQHLNNDVFGGIWTLLYEFNQSPCVSHVIMMQLLLETLLGPEDTTVVTATPATKCMYTTDKMPNEKGFIPDPLCFIHKMVQDTVCLQKDGTGPCMRKGPNLYSMANEVQRLAPVKKLALAFDKMMDLVAKPLKEFRSVLNTFYTTKAFVTDPLDVMWMHASDIIGMLEIFFMIPVKAHQELFESLVTTLKLVPVTAIVNKAMEIAVAAFFKNPLATAALKGPLKVCTLILGAFTNNPVTREIIDLMKSLFALMDKPVKFEVKGKKYCFTIYTLLKSSNQAFERIVTKAMPMVKGILKPLFKLIDGGLKTLVSLVKLPKIKLIPGLFGKSNAVFENINSLGSLADPVQNYMTCAFNLPWVMESGQNMCSCCFSGWMTANKQDGMYKWNAAMDKVLFKKKKFQCGEYGYQNCALNENDKKDGSMELLTKPTCPFNAVSGAVSATGALEARFQRCAYSKAKQRSASIGTLIMLFKGFMCRFQSVGINPANIMQVSPMPPVNSLRRRRQVALAEPTTGQKQCACYLSDGKDKKACAQQQPVAQQHKAKKAAAAAEERAASAAADETAVEEEAAKDAMTASEEAAKDEATAAAKDGNTDNTETASEEAADDEAATGQVAGKSKESRGPAARGD